MTSDSSNQSQVLFHRSSSPWGFVAPLVLIACVAAAAVIVIGWPLPSSMMVNGQREAIHPAALFVMVLMGAMGIGGILLLFLSEGCGNEVRVLGDGRVEVRLQFGLGARIWRGRIQDIRKLAIRRWDGGDGEVKYVDELYLEIANIERPVLLGKWKAKHIETLAASLNMPVPRPVIGEQPLEQDWWSTRSLATTSTSNEKTS